MRVAYVLLVDDFLQRLQRVVGKGWNAMVLLELHKAVVIHFDFVLTLFLFQFIFIHVCPVCGENLYQHGVMLILLVDVAVLVIIGAYLFGNKVLRPAVAVIVYLIFALCVSPFSLPSFPSLCLNSIIFYKSRRQ